MGDSSDRGRPPYSYEEVKAFLGNARLPRNPGEEQAFAREDAYNNGIDVGRQEVIAFVETNFLKIWEAQLKKWSE